MGEGGGGLAEGCKKKINVSKELCLLTKNVWGGGLLIPVL